MKITELQEKYKLSKDDFWELPQKKGMWIITHDAIERIATQEKIVFGIPQVHTALDSIGLYGEAWTPDYGSNIWTFGEASKENVAGKGKYYWAMAEKRLKDRLVLKLIKAYEYGIYSETEADDFKKPTKAKTYFKNPVDMIQAKIDSEKVTAPQLRTLAEEIEKSDKFDEETKTDFYDKIEKRISELSKEE